MITVLGFYTAMKNRPRKAASKLGVKKDHQRESHNEIGDQNQMPELAIPTVSHGFANQSHGSKMFKQIW